MNGWESPETKGTWPTHMLTADVPTNSFHSFCFAFERQVAPPQYSSQLLNTVSAHKTSDGILCFIVLLCILIISTPFKCPLLYFREKKNTINFGGKISMSYFPMFWPINLFLFVLVCPSAGINKKELTFLQNLERLRRKPCGVPHS